MRRPGEADAAVLRLPGGNAIAVAIDGSGRSVAADPYTGTIENVLECAANLACVGAEPLGLTNCLNFGNPEKSHIAWQLSESIRGLGDACRALGVPVVGGNVSLYNEGAEGPIYPTPVVGLVGGMPDAARAGGLAFAAEGDAVGLVGPFAPGAPGLGAREAARRGAARRPPGGGHLGGALGARRGPRGGPRGHAEQRARHRRGRPRGRAGGVRARRRRRRARDDRARRRRLGAALRRVARRGFVVSGPAEALEALGAEVLGEVGGDGLTLTAGDVAISATLAELREAHGSFAALFP